MSIAAAVVGAASALVQALTGAVGSAGAAKVIIPATKNGGGKNGIDIVKNWPGGWKPAEHAKNVMKCLADGKIGPWRWVPVAVSKRLTVFVMHDALSIGDDPPCRIPINQSGCQRLLDKLGAQLGRKILMPTPVICDAVHLAAFRCGRVVEQVSIWTDKTEPTDPTTGKPRHLGADVPQWLRQQVRLKAAIAAAGGYPTSGAVSTVGKDVTLSPLVTDHARAGDASGETPGPKMEIYGWHLKQPPALPSKVGGVGGGPSTPFLFKELTAIGYLSVQQGESTWHGDTDDGELGSGGFWDYSSTLRGVLEDCLLDGQVVKLSDIYQKSPDLVYRTGSRPIPVRYPLVSTPST